MENKIIDLEIQNKNVDQHSRRNNVEISGIPQSVRNNQLEEKVVDILKTITKRKMLLFGLLTENIVFKHCKIRKSSSPSMKMV